MQPDKTESVLRTQFSYASYVILALSVAALGFQMTFVLNAQFDPADPWQRSALIAALLSLFVFFLSVASGVLVLANRMRDLRADMRAATAAKDGADPGAVECQQKLSAKLGRRNWPLLWFHLGTFGFGVFLAVIAVALSAIAALLSYGEPAPGCDI
jgi:hypothetical protein